MAAVNCLYVTAASTAASAAALQWWASSLLDGEAGAGGDGDWLGAVLRSRVTVALLANLAAHVFLVAILALKVTTLAPLFLLRIWGNFVGADLRTIDAFPGSTNGDWIVVVYATDRAH